MCVLLAVWICFCSAACKQGKIYIGVMADLDSLPVAYAYLQGYLPENMELQVFTSAPVRDSALLSHNLAGCVSDLLSAVQLADTGADIRVPVTTGGSYALMENDSALGTVAISSGTIIEYMCDTMQTGYEKTVIASMAERCTMLLENKVKAAVLPEPFAAYAAAQGCRYAAHNTDTKAGVMIFYTDFAESAAFDDFITAYNRAVQEITQGADLSESMQLLGFPKVDIEAFDLQYTKAAPPDEQSFAAVTAYMREHLAYQGKVQYDALCT